jgi:RHS repeat-associated protein
MEIGEVDACPFRYQTKWYDAESQQYYFGYRYYDPRVGRWLSRDPLGEQGGVNLYAYCGNDPVNRHDPLGLSEYGDAADAMEGLLPGVVELSQNLAAERGAVGAALWGGGVPFGMNSLMSSGGFGGLLSNPLFQYDSQLGGMQSEASGMMSGLREGIRFNRAEDYIRSTLNRFYMSGGRMSSLHQDYLRKAYGSWGYHEAEKKHLWTKVYSPAMIANFNAMTTVGQELLLLPTWLVGLGEIRAGSSLISAGRGTLNAVKGIPESARALPFNGEKAFIWTSDVKIAGVNPLTGNIYANPNIWKQLTVGQRSTVFWEEFSHQGRVLGRPMWMRQANARLYKTSLGKFMEETMARTSAMRSFRQGVGYGWNYPGVSKSVVLLEGAGVVGVPAAAGYFAGDLIFEE